MSGLPTPDGPFFPNHHNHSTHPRGNKSSASPARPAINNRVPMQAPGHVAYLNNGPTWSHLDMPAVANGTEISFSAPPMSHHHTPYHVSMPATHTYDSWSIPWTGSSSATTTPQYGYLPLSTSLPDSTNWLGLENCLPSYLPVSPALTLSPPPL